MTLKNSLPYLFVVAALLVGAYLVGVSTPTVGAATEGLPATVATTSQNAVSTSVTTLFSTSTCAARIITSRAAPLMLTFSDYANQTPTATFGHLQAASTTVVYDSAEYGCGRVKVYAYAADTITLTETR